MTIEITYILMIIFVSFVSIFSYIYTCYRHCLGGYEISYYHEKYLGLDEGRISDAENQNIRKAKEELDREVRQDIAKLAILQNPRIYLDEDWLSIKSEIHFAKDRIELSSQRYHPDSFLRKIVIVEDIYERHQSGIQKGTQ